MSKKKEVGSYKDNLKARGDEARTVRKVVVIIILLLLLVFTVGGISAYNFIKTALDPVDITSDEEISVTIPMGSSTSSIGKILEKEGIIKDARVFRFYIKFKNQSDFQAGDYTFTKSFTLDEIIESLKSGRVMAESIYTVTIPEGKTIDQMAGIYSNKLPFTEEEFLNKVSDKAYLKSLIGSYPNILSEDILDPDIKAPLEGYLFASTYDFYQEDPSVESVIEMMLDKTAKIVNEYRDRLNDIMIDGEPMTVHEALTFASMVEKEEPNPKKRKTIAGVFYNRLDQSIRLQTDPTVTYTFDEKIDVVLNKHLEEESPYNTYRIDGLPIGPISNFSENALEATVEPEETPFYYFLHDEDKNVHFSETYDEHLKLKKQYLD